jgi:hypothetical protein
MLPAEQIFLAKLMRYLQQVWLVGAMCLLAIVVLRRLMGGFHTPLGFSTAALFGLLLAVHAYGLRLCLRRESWQTWPVLEFDRNVSLGTWLLLFTIIIPGTDNLTWMMLLLPWAAADLYWWCTRFEPPPPIAVETIEIPVPAHPLTPSPLVPTAEHATASEVEEGLVASQKMICTESYELITGVMQIQFQAEQQTAVVHVPFHPPLSHDPEIIAEADDCQVRVTEARTYGMRLEVKRANADLAPASVQLNYEALVEKEEE